MPCLAVTPPFTVLMKIGPPQLNGEFALGFYGFRPTLPDTALPFWKTRTPYEKPAKLPPLPARRSRRTSESTP